MKTSPLNASIARLPAWPLLLAALVAASAMAAEAAPPSARDQVLEAERGFARTMAERDHRAFTAFLSDEAIFFGGEAPLRGKEAVAAGWARYFTDRSAPFSWEPDAVEVLASGGLALSTGPVRDPDGKVIARFNSIWRLEPPGVWRIVFDKGSPPSPGPPP